MDGSDGAGDSVTRKTHFETNDSLPLLGVTAYTSVV
jgi:hypothetical protein